MRHAGLRHALREYAFVPTAPSPLHGRVARRDGGRTPLPRSIKALQNRDMSRPMDQTDKMRSERRSRNRLPYIEY